MFLTSGTSDTTVTLWDIGMPQGQQYQVGRHAVITPRGTSQNRFDTKQSWCRGGLAQNIDIFSQTLVYILAPVHKGAHFERTLAVLN